MTPRWFQKGNLKGLHEAKGESGLGFNDLVIRRHETVDVATTLGR